MTEKPKAGCARPTGGLVGQSDATQKSQTPQQPREEKKMIQVISPLSELLKYRRSPIVIRSLKTFCEEQQRH
jgi:hypothetical protein